MSLVFQEYPLVMRHPNHQPATQITDPMSDLERKAAVYKPNTWGKAALLPDVTVHNKDQEEQFASKGYRRSGVSDPEAYARSRAGEPTRDSLEYQEYPKWKYHASKEPKLVSSKTEEIDLGPWWFDRPDMVQEEIVVAPVAPVPAIKQAPKGKRPMSEATKEKIRATHKARREARA